MFARWADEKSEYEVTLSATCEGRRKFRTYLASIHEIFGLGTGGFWNTADVALGWTVRQSLRYCMNKPVHQFLLRCRPTLNNRHYHAWQTAYVVLFVADYDRMNALNRSYEILAKERWTLIETQRRATLIEKEVRKEGGDVLNAYLTAQVEGHWIKVFPDHTAVQLRGDMRFV
jgi:hypothetical protein